MKKFLTLLSLLLVAIGAQARDMVVYAEDNAQAIDQAIFNFNYMTDVGTSSSESTDGDITEDRNFVENGVTLTVSPSTTNTPNRLWGWTTTLEDETSIAGAQLRAYSGTLTLSAEQNITKVEFNINGTKFDLTPDVGELTEQTWEGSAKTIVFTVNKNTQLNVITVTLEKEDVPEPDPTYLVNPDFTDGINGWTLATAGGGWSTPSEDPKVIEAYAGWANLDMTDFSLLQDVTLPAGSYKLEAYAFYRYGVNADVDPSISNAQLVAGDFSTPVATLASVPLDENMTAYANSIAEASAAFAKGYYKNTLDFQVGADGTVVTLGIKGAHTLKQSWFIAGPFTLTRTGDFDISGIVEAYEKALANAQAVDQSAPMDEEVLAALQAAIAAEVDKTSPNALTEAINTLNEATAAAKASIAEKAAIKAIADAAGHELDDTNVYTAESYATFMEAAEAIKAKYAEGTLTLAEANEYKNNVWNTGWHSANTIDDVLLSSWTIGGVQATDYDTALYINTWSVEGDGDGTNFRVPFFEYWTGDGNPLGAKVIQATVTGLEPGKPYQAEAWVRLRKNDVSITDNGITFAVGDGEAIALNPTTAGMNQLFCDVVSATGNADAEGNLTITFDVAEGNNVSWLSFKNVKYAPYYVASNLDFEIGTPVSEGICTYEKDMETNGTSLSRMQPVDGWAIAGENGDAHAGGLFAYGSDENVWLGGKGYLAPAAGPEGSEGKQALGLVAVWSATAQYTQPITLEPGNYAMVVPVYNSVGGASVPVKSLIGFIADDGTEYLAPAKAYPVGVWTQETITFTLTERTTGVISLGYQGQNTGSGNAQHLFFDGVEIEEVSDADLARAELVAAVAGITLDPTAAGEGLFQVPVAAYNAYAEAVNKADGVASTDDLSKEDYEAALAELNAAVEAYKAAGVNLPEEGVSYTFKQKASGLYLSFDVENAGVVLGETPAELSFVAGENGGWYLTNGTEYVGFVGSNNWTMSPAAEYKYEWAVAYAGEGFYKIYKPSNANHNVGTNDTELSVGAPCYADKNNGDNILWTIEKVLPPVPEPTPYTWTYDFENADENVNIVGGGAVVDDETPNFGKVFENVSTTVRTNYMTLPDTVLAQSAISKELSIAFWVNANGKAPETYPYAPFFTAYANNTGGADNSFPMLALQSRGLAQVNCNGWTDFTGADNVEGKNNVYNQSAWEANDPAYNFVENWLADNEWHYYTAVFTEEGLTIYLDGEVKNKWGIGTANPENTLAGLFSNGGDLKHICLGGNQAWNWGDPDAPFRFDDVLITNYVLTPEVIAEIIAAKNYVEPGKEYVYTDLTEDMFKEWDGVTADAQVVNDNPFREYQVGTEVGAGGTIYGNGSVLAKLYADLTEYDHMIIEVASGTPRLLFNRTEDNSSDYLEINSPESAYVTVDENGNWIIDLAAIKAEKGFVHLNVMKSTWGGPATVTAIKLGKEKGEEPQVIYVGEEAIPVVATISQAVEMTEKVAYEGTTAEFDVAAVVAALGIEDIASATQYFLNPDDTTVPAAYGGGTIDGWHNAEGFAAEWGASANGVCVKIQDPASGIIDYLGAHDGNFAAGDTYKARFAFVADGKAAIVDVDITFVKPAAPDIEISENVISASVEYDVADASYIEKIVTLTDEQVAAICTELGISALSEATVYGYNPTTKELVKNYGPYDGWRDANGDFNGWTGTPAAPACVKYEDGQNYFCYNLNGCEAGTIDCYWAIATETKAVLVKISFIYTDATAPVDLTQAMYHEWDKPGVGASIVNEETYCEYHIGESTGNLYGNPSVLANTYADLSAYNYLVVTTSAGIPRFLFNRPTNDSQEYINIPNDEAQTAKYETVYENADGTKSYVINLQAIVADYGFAQLDAIKGAYWQDATIESMKLYSDITPVAINGVEVVRPIEGIFDLNGQKVSVPVKGNIYIINGKKVLVK